MDTYTIYSKDGCPFCVRVKQVMRLAELKHVVYELNKDFDRSQFYAEFGDGSTFPQVVKGETKLGGCTETVRYLKESGII